MFQLNETEMWRERRQGLLNEAEGERFTLRIGWACGGCSLLWRWLR